MVFHAKLLPKNRTSEYFKIQFTLIGIAAPLTVAVTTNGKNALLPISWDSTITSPTTWSCSTIEKSISLPGWKISKLLHRVGKNQISTSFNQYSLCYLSTFRSSTLRFRNVVSYTSASAPSPSEKSGAFVQGKKLSWCHTVQASTFRCCVRCWGCSWWGELSPNRQMPSFLSRTAVSMSMRINRMPNLRSWWSTVSKWPNTTEIAWVK